jgi:hypothetical protein
MVGGYRDGPLSDIAHQADLVHVAPACERLGDDRELAPAQIEFGVRILETTGRPVPMGTEGLSGPATG